MLLQNLKHKITKTSLTTTDVQPISTIVDKKLAGRQPDYFMFNSVNYKITDVTIDILRSTSNKAKDFIKLGDAIKIALDETKDLKIFFDYFTGRIEKYNRFKFISKFENLIDYSDYKYLTIDEIDTRLLLEYFWQKEEFELSYQNIKISEKRSSNLRTDYSFYIFEEDELNSLNKLKDTSYNIYLFNLELIELVSYTKLNLIKLNSIDFENEPFISNYSFPTMGGFFEFPKINELPFNHLDTQPRYSYPLLANSVILPLTHRLPDKNDSYQQVELSTSASHTAFYFRKARWVYTIDKQFLHFTLFLDLLSDLEINIKETLLSKIITILKSTTNSLVAFEKLKKSLKKDFEKVKDIIIKIYNLERLFSKDKIFLSEQINLILTNDYYSELVNDVIIIVRDVDIFKKDIPFFYLEKEDGSIEYCFDLEKKNDLYKETNFIVAKEMYDYKGKTKAIDITSVRDKGIDAILNNDTDFPIKEGIYDINTPKLIYYPPIKNNFIKKGVFCYDGILYHNWLKRTRVLYIPDFWMDRVKNETSDEYQKNKIDGSFVIPNGRELSGLPVLIYSYIITPMTDIDKLIYFEKY